MALEFKGAKLIFFLECQAPIIHFQQSATGVTLRASEVKPKLDRYIRYIIEKKGESIPKEWRVSEEKAALNYKIRFEDNKSEVVDIGKNPLYYGNSNKKREEQKKYVWTNPKVTIFCLIPKLQEVIRECIEDFFIVTNFGTMQGKGFGSFLVRGSQKNSAEVLMKEYGLSKVYGAKIIETKTNQFIPDKQSIDKKMEFIKQFYSLTKSGNNPQQKNNPKLKYKRSALFCYMHNKGIDNEKAYLKFKKIMEITGDYKKEGPVRTPSNPKYVRIMLGQGREISVRGGDNKITIEHKEKIIERFASPLTFKIIGSMVYIIPKKLPMSIFKQKYKFTQIPSRNGRNKSNNPCVVLDTPDAFDLQEFLDYAVTYYNNNGKETYGQRYLIEDDINAGGVK